MALRTRRCPATSPAARLALPFALILLPAAALGAACPRGLGPLVESLRDLYAYNRPWDALRLAQACGRGPGLESELGEIRSMIGDHHGAEESFKNALRRKPDDAASLLGLARTVRDRPGLALRYARQAAALGGPAQAAALRLSGEIRLDLEDDAGAAEDYARAVALDGRDLESLGALARLRRDPAYADAACRAAEASPGWSRAAAFRSCAGAWLELKEHIKAVQSLRRALDAAPDDLDVLAALVALKRERPGETIDWGKPSVLGAEAARRDGLEGLRASIEEERAAGSRERALALADRFVLSIPGAPAWQRLAAYALAARLLADLGETAKARAVADRAQREDPDSLEIRRLLVETNAVAEDLPYFKKNVTYGYLVAVRARRRLGDADGAASTLERALAEAPGDPQALQEAVSLELSRGRLEEARRAAKRLLEASAKETVEDLYRITPDFPHLAAIGGRTPQESARKAMASPAVVGRLEGALARDRSDARRLMVRVLLAPEARASLEEALAASPEDLPALEAMSIRRLEEGRPKEALPYVQRLIDASRKAPAAERAAAYRLQARARRALKDDAAAEASLRQALDAAPEDPQALVEMINLELALGRRDLALSYAGRRVAAAREAPSEERAGAYLQKAMIERALGLAAEASESLRQALAMTPEDPPLLAELAQLELSRGRIDEARRAAERLVAASERQSLADVVERSPMDFAPGFFELNGETMKEQLLTLLSAPEFAARAKSALEKDRARAREILAEVLRAGR